jgi:hypothetical protein
MKPAEKSNPKASKKEELQNNQFYGNAGLNSSN